ncbi:hypothetical protein D3C84_802290 [compost metagenome]
MATKAVMKASVFSTFNVGSFIAACTSRGLGDRAIWHSLRRSFCKRTLASGVMAKMSGSTEGLPPK